MKLSYLSLGALIDLTKAVDYVIQNQIPGLFIEAGCALGGSAIIITSAKPAARKFYVYDTFEQIPPPTENDDRDAQERYRQIIIGEAVGIGGKTYYGYKNNLKQEVERNFSLCGYPVEKNHVSLVKGLFQDTLNLESPIAFAHLDCDWYDSVMTCLEKIVPLLSPGGILVIDDYDDWSGCQKAVNTYFQEKREHFIFTQKTRLHIQKK
jgi:hypothetical protein